MYVMGLKEHKSVVVGWGIELSGPVTAYHDWDPAFEYQQLTHRHPDTHISLPIPYEY